MLEYYPTDYWGPLGQVTADEDLSLERLEAIGLVLTCCRDRFSRELASPSCEDDRGLMPAMRQRLVELVRRASRGDKTSVSEIASRVSTDSTPTTGMFVNYHLLERLRDWLSIHQVMSDQEVRNLGKTIQEAWFARNDSFIARMCVNYYIGCHLFSAATYGDYQKRVSELTVEEVSVLAQRMDQAEELRMQAGSMLSEFYRNSPIKRRLTEYQKLKRGLREEEKRKKKSRKR